MPARLAVALGLTLALAAGRADAADDPAKSASELQFCRTYPEAIAPPGARVGDVDAFCRCYAEAAQKAGLPALERAEANIGQDVAASDADRARSIRARKSDAAARGCLKP